MFEECIPFFRPERIEENEGAENINELRGYILLDFELEQTLEFKDFKILPTIRANLSPPYSTFIAPVILPRWLNERHNAHLFCIALGAIVSFVTSRPVKSLRDGYLIGRELDEHTIQTLSIHFPVLTAGPGSHNYRLSKEYIERYYKGLKDTIELLYAAPYTLYVRLMKAMRLAHLAHNNKREDFSLAYYLLVSSIEVITQKATKVPKIKHDLENQWEQMAKSDETISELFAEYKKLRSNDKKLRERFVEFVFEYCPPKEWEKLEHPQESSLPSEDRENWEWITKKSWDEIYPEDLQNEDSKDELLREIISDSYKYRSKFTHEGSAPPHRQPNSYNRFFDVEHQTKEMNGKYEFSQIILANFSLLAFIAKNSIIAYAKSKVSSEKTKE
ncbi:hypothetical protein [Peribacillus butanolivorans]|uniref:hypothetical protein n=1 Tax=Peribacillus butanolivorans TaxID=421767 RepID=UPI0036DB249B